MGLSETTRIMAEAFAALPKRNRRILKHHLETKTPIFCGPDSNQNYFCRKTGFV